MKNVTTKKRLLTTTQQKCVWLVYMKMFVFMSSPGHTVCFGGNDDFNQRIPKTRTSCLSKILVLNFVSETSLSKPVSTQNTHKATNNQHAARKSS